MDLDFAAILTIVLGNGLAIAIATIVFNYLTGRSQKHFEARKDARLYYMELYSKIVNVADILYAKVGPSLINKKKAQIFSNIPLFQLPPDEINKRLEEAMKDFYDFYTQKRREGYDVYVSNKLFRLLEQFLFATSVLSIPSSWDGEDIYGLKAKDITPKKTYNIAEDIRENMQKLFGLR
jgi:hypothetical protein